MDMQMLLQRYWELSFSTYLQACYHFSKQMSNTWFFSVPKEHSRGCLYVRQPVCMQNRRNFLWCPCLISFDRSFKKAFMIIFVCIKNLVTSTPNGSLFLLTTEWRLSYWMAWGVFLSLVWFLVKFLLVLFAERWKPQICTNTQQYPPLLMCELIEELVSQTTEREEIQNSCLFLIYENISLLWCGKCSL